MDAKAKISRRDFLKISAATGGGLMLALYLPGCAAPPDAPEPTSTSQPTTTPTPEPVVQFEPSLFVRIDEQGVVTITVPRMEMGQGVRTALPMILAEELEADWRSIQVETAVADRAYGRQRTTGSHSVEHTFSALRQAGATAREMLITAASQTWGVEKEMCCAEQGQVIHQPTGKSISYGDLVEPASTLPLPEEQDVTLKNPGEFHLIGTPMSPVDAPQMVTGHAVYGTDVRLPDLLYATIARCPVPDGGAISHDPSQALEILGVRHVVEIDGGVAVLAENTWAAIQGREALQITWDEGKKAVLNSTNIHQTTLQKLEDMANISPPMGSEDEILDLIYEVPFLAHATMEPMNCTADVRPDQCTVWAPTQSPLEAKRQAISITGLPKESVTVKIPLMGGGFGRRNYVDYVAQAVMLSKIVKSPVQVVWTRQDDIQHDYYHPFSLSHATARLDDPSRRTIVPYTAETAIPTGIWRSVDNVHQAFAHECLIDELAAANNRDPYEFHRELLNEQERVVLDLAAEKADWGTALPERWGRGLAFHSTWGVTHVAQVAEVSFDQDGTLSVHRVVCAIDCGIVVNPDMVAAQMEGGIAMGLTAALKGEITIKNGRVQQSNFHDYPILNIAEMPEVEVYIVPSDRDPEGVGEMGLPPSIPAVANALYAATGVRIRKLPIRADDLRNRFS